jgi:transcriptional regulator
MYIPRKFALTDEQTAAALAAAEFAQLVSHDPSGLLVTPLPLMYDAAAHSLVGHVSRANPH